MATKIYVQNFIPGMDLRNEVLYVEEKGIRIGRKGPYIDLVLRDKTGDISSKIWDHTDQFDAQFSRGDFISVCGKIETFNDKPQLRIETIDRLETETIDLMDFVESLPEDQIESGFNKILKFIEEIKDPHLRQLLDSFFQDPEFVKAFRRAPGAKSIHHAKIGGLIKHVVFMLLIAKSLAQCYKVLNTDILYTGIILHDMGKTRELSVSTSINYTEEGEMIGHSVIGVSMIRERARTLPVFPERLLMLLEHLLLSHHGEPEFGAVKRPLFREAMLLHYIDNIDAKMELMTTTLNKAAEESIWTEKVWSLENIRLLRIDRFLNDADEANT